MGEMIRKMKENLGRYSLFLVFQIIILICQFTIFNDGALDYVAKRNLLNGSSSSIFGGIILFFLSPLLASYLATINKNILLGKRKEFGAELREGLSYYWRVLGGTLLIALIIFGVAVGMALLAFIPVLGILGVIVGLLFLVYVVVMYSTIAEAIVFRDCGVSEGMDTCKAVSKEHFGELFLLYILVGILNIITAMIGGTGVLVSISIITMLYSIFASYYRITLVYKVFGGDDNEVIEEKEDDYPGI